MGPILAPSRPRLDDASYRDERSPVGAGRQGARGAVAPPGSRPQRGECVEGIVDRHVGWRPHRRSLRRPATMWPEPRSAAPPRRRASWSRAPGRRGPRERLGVHLDDAAVRMRRHNLVQGEDARSECECLTADALSAEVVASSRCASSLAAWEPRASTAQRSGVVKTREPAPGSSRRAGARTRAGRVPAARSACRCRSPHPVGTVPRWRSPWPSPT